MPLSLDIKLLEDQLDDLIIKVAFDHNSILEVQVCVVRMLKAQQNLQGRKDLGSKEGEFSTGRINNKQKERLASF
uniref:Uncharacterized protein n=1 Tax=Anolis carolinensis TaxID=28377 RepID=A0A803TCC5_ANOCA